METTENLLPKFLPGCRMQRQGFTSSLLTASAVVLRSLAVLASGLALGGSA